MPSAILLPRVPDCGCVSAALGVASAEGGSQGKDSDCVPPQAQISSTGSRCSGGDHRVRIRIRFEHLGLNPGIATYSCVTLDDTFAFSVQRDHSNPSPVGLL